MKRGAGRMVIGAGLAFAGLFCDHGIAAGPVLVASPLRFEAARLAADRLDLAALAVPLPFELRRGETVGGVLGSLGLDPPEVALAVEALREHVDPRRIRAGETGVAYLDDEDGLARLELELAGKGRLELERDGESWRSSFRAAQRRVVPARIEGVLEGFLATAVERAGAGPSLAYAMADVLQWDLDFNRDLQPGDRFRVLYEDVTLDGRPAGVGRILALSYETGGKVYEAYLWGDEDGYYDGQGRPLQKQFLRSPLPFSRVTSRFSGRRFHPVLKVYRPHYGVDYGAPVGTPVRTTASGTVVFAGRSGGSGNMVKVRHANGYLTAYLHLSGFSSAGRVGRRVRQGEVVGYVGATGLATAAHLDYRVQLDGRWIDPLSIKTVAAEPVPASRLQEFAAGRDRLVAALDGEISPFLPAPEPPTVLAAAGLAGGSAAVAR